MFTDNFITEYDAAEKELGGRETITIEHVKKEYTMRKLLNRVKECLT